MDVEKAHDSHPPAEEVIVAETSFVQEGLTTPIPSTTLSSLRLLRSALSETRGIDRVDPGDRQKVSLQI